MTTFRHAARKPRPVLDTNSSLADPLARRHRKQREVRLHKIRLWAQDREFRPKGFVAFTKDVNVDALTYARANILKDIYNLTNSEMLGLALETYCALLVKKQSIEHEDKAVEAWVNGTES